MSKDTGGSNAGRCPAIVPQRTSLQSSDLNAFGTYHDLVQSSGGNTFRYGSRFSATITAYRFPDLLLFDRQIEGAEHRRDRKQIQRDGFEHYYLHVLRSGRMACGPFGDEKWLSPGDAVLLDATLPQNAVSSGADYVTVTLARSIIEAAMPDARRLHGRVLPRAANGFIGDAILALSRQAPGLSIGDAVGGGQLIAGLLSKTWDHTIGTVETDEEPAVDVSRRLLAADFIDAHIGDQDLNVTAVAEGIGVSRSTLYRVFRPSGGIEREIVRRRIARLKAHLLMPGEKRSLDSLAYVLGFASPSHCSRVFKDAYGLSPNVLRAELRVAAGETIQSLEYSSVQEWYSKMNSFRSDDTN